MRGQRRDMNGQGDGSGTNAPAVAAGTCLVVAAEADGVGPSVLLTVNAASRRQYLFSCAEGGAVQVDPGISQLTPRLLSTLETKT